jgi:Family of unknown function (DUF5709)
MTIPNDPESEGIPDVAVDTSLAYDSKDRPGFEDSPPALPTEDAVATDEYGITAYEGSHDEPLSSRLVREEPDISPDTPETSADDGIADEATTDEMLTQASRDTDEFGFGPDEDVDLNQPLLQQEVGRLVEDNEGSVWDDEAKSVGYDSDEGEGLSAEEAAIHEIPEEDIPYHE